MEALADQDVWLGMDQGQADAEVVLARPLEGFKQSDDQYVIKAAPPALPTFIKRWPNAVFKMLSLLNFISYKLGIEQH